MINRLFTEYIDPNASTVFRSNVEFAAPFLWRVLPAYVKQQIVRRVDREITGGNADTTKQAFSFVEVVAGTQYLSVGARKYLLAHIVARLKANLDRWAVENECVRQLEPYAASIPKSLLTEYVHAIVMTYVGNIGSSSRFNRTDFYANDASIRIPKMIEAFDENAALAFVNAIRGDSKSALSN